VPVSNGMKMAVEEINAAGGIHGRKIKMILEDSGYDPKRAVLASQKMIERDKIFAMVGPMGSPTVLASQDVSVRCRRAAVVSAHRGRIHLQVRPGQAAGTAEVQQPAALLSRSTRAAVKYMVEQKGFQEALHHAPG